MSDDGNYDEEEYEEPEEGGYEEEPQEEYEEPEPEYQAEPEPEEEPEPEPEEPEYEEPEPEDEPEPEPEFEEEPEPEDQELDEQEPEEEPEPEDQELDEQAPEDEMEPEEQPEEEPDPEEQEPDEETVPEDERDDLDGPIEMDTANENNADNGPSAAVEGALDGFGGGFGDILSNIGGLVGGGGGALTNVFSSGGMEGMVGKAFAEAAQGFLKIDPETGAMIGAQLGNLIFNTGGRGNALGNIGKIVLENLLSGKFKRDVHPFVPPVPRAGGTEFGLDFNAERDRCLQEKRLFEDPEFPAADQSIYYKTPPERAVTWMRPGEICPEPQLIVGEKSRFDVKQGALGDCWLLAAVANLTLRDELFYRVVPPDQSFTELYAGIFHFQFWRYGKWTDVVIDDRLPTVDGQLIYMHSHEKNEFWSALIEKAYAKLYGSYENLEGGTTAEALEDFTGGLTEFFDLRKTDKSTVLAMMVRGFQMGSLFGCSIDADPAQKEAPLENGLVRGHAYSMTAIQTVQGSQGEMALVRIRNPWGNSKEWNGAWSDDSPEWNTLSEEQKQQMGVNFAQDGEFWMSFDDFYTNFQEMEICNLSAGVMNEISEMTGVEVNDPNLHQWEERAQDGEWSTEKGTAGGCANNPDTYPMNPQFGSYFTVTSDSVEQDGKCTVIVAVLQKYRREMRTIGEDSLPIGFAVYQVENEGQLPANFFDGKRPIARNKVFINQREVTSRFRVVPGQYVIVPSTFDPNCNGEFLLRIYANGEIKSTRLR